MDFEQAYQAYVSRCQQLQAHQISAAEFTAWLDRLRVQDAQGQWWQIEHPSGEWLCWNGQAWERRHPPGQSIRPRPAQPSQEPQSLGQLLGWLTRSILKTIPQQLILGIIVSGIIWLLHTILVVGLNEGFNASGNPWFNSILVLPSQIMAGTLFWVFTGIFVSQLVHGTLGKTFTAIATLPKTLVRFCQQSSQFKAPILWLGLAGTLVLSIFFGNLLVSLQAMVFALVALQDSNHILRLVLKLGWHDVQKLRSGGQAQHPLTPGQSQQLLLGIVMGCSVAALLFWLFPSFLQLTAIVVIALTIFQFFAGNRPTPSTLSLFVLFILGSLILGYSDPAWADDGGWQEAGGRIDLWIQSPGALTAVALGVPASLGSWLGWILGGLPNPFESSPATPTVIYGTGTPDDPFRDYPDAKNPPWMQGVYGAGTVDDPYRDYESLPTDINQTPDDVSDPEETDSDLFPPDDILETGETDSSDSSDSSELDLPELPEDEDEFTDDEPDEASEEPEQTETPTSVTPEQLQQLQEKFQEMVNQKLKEGYYVKNPGLISKAWNWTLGGAGKWLAGYKGGQCGEFGQWGMEWSKDFVEKNFGKSAIIDDITILEKSTVDPSGVLGTLDSLVDINHRATRVTLPTGERYVLDYWEAMGRSGGSAKLIPEKEWVDKWVKAVGENDAYPDTRSTLQESLKISLQQAEGRGIAPEKVFEKFRKDHPGQAETIINSWKKEPW